MSSRNTFCHDGFILEKLQNHEDIETFDCGDKDLNEYFREDSKNYRAELMTQTYCFYRENSSQKDAVALIDFCNDSLARNFIPNKCRRKNQSSQARIQIISCIKNYAFRRRYLYARKAYRLKTP